MSIQKQKDKIKRYEIKFVFTNKDENKLLKNNKLKKIFPDRIVESYGSRHEYVQSNY